MLMHRGAHDGWEIYGTSWGLIILTGAALGTLMFLNVWLIIWPNQKIVIASTESVLKGGKADPAAAAAGAKAALASRTNTLFSIPMLFMMGAGRNLPVDVPYEYNCTAVCVALVVIIGGLELNGIKGKMGPMESVKGVIHSGLGLTVVLYLVIEFLT